MEEKKYLLHTLDYRDEGMINKLGKDWLKCESFNKKVAGIYWSLSPFVHVAPHISIVIYRGTPRHVSLSLGR